MRASSARHWLAALALLAAPAMADWKQDYGRGLEAAKSGRWDDVERYMRSALEGNPEPAERLRLYGQRYEIYAPQHYLGMAALRQGDCATALRLWSQGGNESFIGAFPDLADEERQGRAECNTRLVRQGQAPTPTQVVPKETPQAKPQASPSPPPPAPSRPVAVAPPPSRPAPDTPPLRPTADTGASRSVNAQILRPLVDAYLDGRYADVIKLSSSVPPTPRLRWHMLTLRAAAAYNLSQLGQGGDADRIARQAANEARQSDPSLKPDTQFFSPKFVRFFAGR